MNSVARCWLGVATTAFLTVHAEAQPRIERVPEALRGPDVTARPFDRSSGLASATAFDLVRDPNGRIWIGTNEGAYVSAGGQWHPEAMPPGIPSQQVRQVLFDQDGGRWFATRVGAFRFADGVWRRFSPAEGVPGDVVYSMVETNAIDGTSRVVLGASHGVCVVRGARCETMALPKGLGTIAFMVHARHGAPQREDLWVASASGGVARLRDGAWTLFTAERGLATQSAEDIILGPPTVDEPVVVLGRDGVFALKTTRDGRERFERIVGAPLIAYRGLWVTPPHAPPELWIGTSDGFISRHRGAQWDTLVIPGVARHGQVTLLRALEGEAASGVVYVGTRGDRLARLAFGAATAYRLPGTATADFVTAIAPSPRPQHTSDVLVVSAGSVNLIDTAGHARRLESRAPPNAIGNQAGYLGPIAPRASDTTVDAGARAANAVNAVTSANAVMVGSVPGLMQFRDGQWSVMPGGAGVVARKIGRVDLPDGTNVLLATTRDRVLRWNGSAWVHDSAFRAIVGAGFTSLRVRGQVTTLIGGRDGVYAITKRGVTFDTVRANDAMRPAWIGTLCTIATPHRTIVFASADDGAVLWRDADSASSWHPLPASIARAINSITPVPMVCADDGHLLIGSRIGLTVSDVSRDDPATWQLSALLGREDGLAASEVTAVGSVFENRLWVGTVFGPSLVDLSRATLAKLVPLTVNVYDDPDGAPLADGVHLPASHNQLRVDAWIDNEHREEDSRFIIEWHRDDAWWKSSSDQTSGSAQQWRDASTRYVTGIEPGAYRLRVRGRDYAGREVAPVEWRVIIDAPWWRTWPAISMYVLAFFGVLRLLYRWRVGVIGQGTARLIASEQRLRASEGKFRSLFDRAQDAHVLVESGRVVGANAVAGRLFGEGDGDALVGREVRSLFAPDTHIAPATTALELVLRHGDHVVPVQLTVTAIDTESGPLLHLVLRDLTEMRAAERERERIELHLRERQRLEALGTLAGGVAHDFNNLLGVIRGNAELADATSNDAASLHEHLASIVDASDRARDLVRQILAFSSSPRPRQESVDLSALLRSLQPLLRRMIPRSVEISILGTDVPHWIHGDPTQLQQVVVNLASNAEYALRARTSGRLTMALHNAEAPEDGPPPVGAVVQLIVSDNGAGMTAAVRDRVFEPFFTTKPTGEGTGLGMAVTHGVVVAHGGRVQLRSAPGEGTAVEISFPAALDALGEATTLPGVDQDDATPLRDGARVVIVDDEPAVARVLERALSRAGYSVRVFATPEAALGAIQRAPDEVDLLLTDQTMPGMTGDMLTERVHAVVPALPVLILTGFSHRLTEERTAAVGAVQVLQKPIELVALHRAVASALRAPAVPGDRE